MSIHCDIKRRGFQLGAGPYFWGFQLQVRPVSVVRLHRQFESRLQAVRGDDLLAVWEECAPMLVPLPAMHCPSSLAYPYRGFGAPNQFWRWNLRLVRAADSNARIGLRRRIFPLKAVWWGAESLESAAI